MGSLSAALSIHDFDLIKVLGQVSERRPTLLPAPCLMIVLVGIVW
jgi:hypothetical protein